MPVFSDFYFELRNMDFRPTSHIKDIIHMWDHKWDPSLGTTPPKAITNETLRQANTDNPTRIVAHYAQPHVPYIGEKDFKGWRPELISDEKENNELRSLFEEGAKRPTELLLEQIRNGEIDLDQLRRAYRSNLDHVMTEVVRLIERLNCPVVITSDHGEHLGDNGYFLHEDDSVVIRQIPWLIVDKAETGIVSNTKDPSNSFQADSYSGSENEVESRLRDLGYK
jgi:membrane-anchored protein YejM (alkaline phosphatase superfamily)